jgi:hypothetical protein
MNIPTLMTPNSAVTASSMATIPKAQRIHLTAQVVTQSKEFREESKFENWMMILCNRVASAWDNGAGARVEVMELA